MQKCSLRWTLAYGAFVYITKAVIPACPKSQSSASLELPLLMLPPQPNAGMIGCGLAMSFEQLLVARWLTGIGSALQNTGAQLFLADISTPANRAQSLGTNQVGVAFKTQAVHPVNQRLCLTTHAHRGFCCSACPPCTAPHGYWDTSVAVRTRCCSRGFTACVHVCRLPP